MIKRKKNKSVSKPYFHNENIFVYPELQFGKKTISNGDLIKIKYQRGTFKFIKLVHNKDKDVTWVDCMDSKTGEFRSFYVSAIKGPTVAKRSRRKKENV